MYILLKISIYSSFCNQSANLERSQRYHGLSQCLNGCYVYYSWLDKTSKFNYKQNNIKNKINPKLLSNQLH